jgi:L-fuculose-phosphate aldolase
MNIIYANDFEAKQMICEFGRRMYEKGLAVSSAGNITCRVSENEVWATPTRVSKGYMKPDMLIKLDLDGNILTKSEYRPSSEIKMHLGLFKENERIQGVVHAHSVFASAFSVIGEDLTASILIEAIFFGKKIPVAHFALPGTNEMLESVVPFCKDYSCALLSNHGAITWGPSIEAAYFRMEALENYCQVYAVSKILGGLKEIPQDKIDAMRKISGL